MDSPTAAQELAQAEADFKKALELRDSDPETAVELLGKVLEIRNKAHGDKALECADTYLYYGELLFEQAQASSDYFGDHMKSAAVQRAKKLAAAEGDAAGQASDDADDEDEDGSSEEAAEDAAAADAEAGREGANPDPHATSNTAAAAAEQQAPEPAGVAQEAAAAEQDGQQPGGAKDEGQQIAADDAMDADEAEEGADDASGDADEDAADAADAAGAEVTGESDDMALAWEMLEMARIIYNQHGSADKHANKLADCHLYIGDILCEQEQFEQAVVEYTAATELLSQVEGGLQAHKRRAAELDFKKATALELSDQSEQALAVMQSAKARLQARIDELTAQLASAAGASTSSAAAAAADAAGAAAFAAFAAVVSTYTQAPAAAAAAEPGSSTEQQDDAAAAAAKQKLEIAELQGTIVSVNDRIEELTAAVQEHTSMKETLRNAFAQVAAGGDPDDEQPPPAADDAAAAAAAPADGKPVASGIGFAAPTGQAGPAVDMGVIGKGKRVVAVPVGNPAPAAAAAAAGADGKKLGEGGSGGSDEGGAGRKHSLSDLVSGDQESAGKEETGAAEEQLALIKAATSAAGQLAAAAAKKART